MIGDQHVLFVEDDEMLREAMVQALELENMAVDARGSATPALRALTPEFDGVVVSDIRLPGMDGLEFFAALQKVDREIPVIFTTGHGDVAMAVEAMKGGASDFLTKPYSASALIESIRRAAEKRKLILENRKLRAALDERTAPALPGTSEQAERLRRLVADVARVDIDLLITGETGTGKSFVARQVHELSSRRDRPFVAIDGGTWSHQDAELIVFGRAPGSGLSRAGLIERAGSGTLFLDDVESIPEPFQARLLSVIEQRSYMPIGASRPTPADIRIISASRGIDASGLAQPFLHRLNGIAVALPPLRDRRADIPDLFRYFVAAFEREFDTDARDLGEIEWRHLVDHDWPGNLHELRSYARAFVLGLEADRGPVPGAPQVAGSLKERVAGFERAVIEDTLRRCDGNVAEALSILSIPRKTFYDKLARYGLRGRDFRPGSD